MIIKAFLCVALLCPDIVLVHVEVISINVRKCPFWSPFVIKTGFPLVHYFISGGTKRVVLRYRAATGRARVQRILFPGNLYASYKHL